MARMTNAAKLLRKITIPLASIGAINWGLFAWFDFNLVEALLGGIPMLPALVYTLVAIGGVFAFGNLLAQGY